MFINWHKQNPLTKKKRKKELPSGSRGILTCFLGKFSSLGDKWKIQCEPYKNVTKLPNNIFWKSPHHTLVSLTPITILLKIVKI